MAKQRTLRCNVRKFLNRPGHHGNATVTAYVERGGRKAHHWPHVFFQLTDCDNSVSLTFDGYTEDDRQNTLYKADTLLAAVTKFRDALYEEAKRFAPDDVDEDETW